MNVLVDVSYATEDDSIPEAARIADWVRRTVTAVCDAGDYEVSVRIVNADEIRALNKEYRDKDTPTNVLSFPAGQVDGLPAAEPQMLGDIVVCAGVVRDEAAAQGKPDEDHWAHMLVHGTLHLLGFDHDTDADAIEMEALEVSILATRGLADPYGAAGENC